MFPLFSPLFFLKGSSPCSLSSPPCALHPLSFNNISWVLRRESPVSLFSCDFLAQHVLFPLFPPRAKLIHLFLFLRHLPFAIGEAMIFFFFPSDVFLRTPPFLFFFSAVHHRGQDRGEERPTSPPFSPFSALLPPFSLFFSTSPFTPVAGKETASDFHERDVPKDIPFPLLDLFPPLLSFFFLCA